MCYILTAIKLQENEQARKALADTVIDKQDYHDDGTGAMLCQHRREPIIRRAKHFTGEMIHNDFTKYDVLSYHLRQASKGKVSMENVHFWRHGVWTFSHNGGIASYGDEEVSDSKVFFKEILGKKYLTKNGKVNVKKIRQLITTSNFWGRCIITNLQSKKLYLFGDFQVYLLNRAYIAITSAVTSFETVINAYGIEFDIDNGMEVLEKKIDGVNMLDLKKQQFTEIETTLKDYSTSYYGNTQHYHASTTHQFGFSPERAKDDNGIYKRVTTTAKKEKKWRDMASFNKEFYGRLESHLKKYPHVEDIIYGELNDAYQNEEIDTPSFADLHEGRTPTEQGLWDLWIKPQIEKQQAEQLEATKNSQTSLAIITDDKTGARKVKLQIAE